jgi:hypothetical protein
MSGKTTQDHHNDGQRDASNGEYNRPHSHTEEFFTWSSDGLKEIREDRAAYQQGHDHGKSQK